MLHDKTEDRPLARDFDAERKALEQLSLLGVRRTSTYSLGRGQLELTPSRLPALVRKLTPEGWRIEAEGNLYRKASRFRFEVTSGIDWFELNGYADFDGERLELPQLLKAVARGENMVRLGDGSFGVLPEEWLNRYGLVASLGSLENGTIRFRASQACLLDALLATQPEVTLDDGFRRIRQELETFAGIQPADPAPTFSGTLRDYQREGLAWLRFLRRFRFGGCLADDMGLGKTVQVLALLDTDERQGPALIVVPRSLVFNWNQEAERFTPRLRVLDLTGAARMQSLECIPDYDLVLTTYGTLRRDALVLKDISFDTIVLDEAQAIKNSETAAAKAAMLMNGRHRLALTGTPIENHLGDLWSIFEFLNPGLLGTVSVFRAHATTSAGTESLQILSKALRPFILRRTKDQVARELPEKTEQVVYCELEGDQRKVYNELRDHYRASLLGRIDQSGLQQSRMHVFEALLRLRQAACHPGLIDTKRLQGSSSKLESLIAQLAEVVSEGHKALVFSQFTSLLAIVKRKLDAGKVPYEYLDGQTRDRQACVRRFQEDDGCRIFLISLKAGGLGLNLTRAEYVFLLDPWWNPAVEAQAIDRTHRIGQMRHVFAYRLIARDTVEEKVLELQKSKRGLAETIINDDNSILASLDRETIEALLS
jgi:SNF2 family DNA or RNA helicase